ncbi:MAG TPA: T9SS type A sorting domain-containing protein [Chitinophagaceae bacterium]|nr:T9SS type A sorting domain-containing protein [Chitinophagaceae bacterium]
MRFLILVLNFLSITTFAQYNFYYGNLHSHTDYSDGNKDSVLSGVSTPGASFAYAKMSYHVDFWGISEHNHYTANNNPGMLLSKYAQGLYQADTSNNNGHFVAMYGMEFGTLSTGGHVVSFGVPQLVGWDTVAGNINYDIFCAKGDYETFWTIVNSYPDAFCTLAHPSTGDFNNLLLAPNLAPSADSAIVGVAIRSGNAYSTTNDYSDPPATSYELQYRRALAKGYRVGPVIDHDNHYTNFGRTLPGRTVVLSSVLNRDSIISAYKARRFYASDDWNTEVLFKVNNAIMGEALEIAGDVNIQVRVSDIDLTDSTDRIQIFHGEKGSGILPTAIATLNNSDSLDFNHAIDLNSEHYYYAKITQKDGDIIWTAPVWVKKTSFPLSNNNLNLTVSLQGENALIQWNAAEASLFELEHSMDGISFVKLYQVAELTPSNTYSFLHEYISPGTHFYRLKQTDLQNDVFYSQIVSVTNTKKQNTYSLYPNPADDFLILDYQNIKNTKAEIRIYDARGILIQNEFTFLSSNSNQIKVDVSCLPTGVYYFVVQKENQRLIDTKFIKR